MHRTLPLVLCLLIGLALLGVHPAVRAEEPPAPPAVDVPVGIPVQIDGRTPAAEWADAAELPLDDGVTTVRVKQLRGTLLIAFETPAPWPEGSVLWFMVQRDEDGVGLYDAGAVRLDYEPLEHDRPHLLAMKHGGTVETRLGTDAAVARSEVGPAGTSLELAVRLADLGVEAEAPQPLRFAVLWSRPRVGTHPTWPPGLRLEAPMGGAPPDLASSTRWGRLGGWVDAGGPGAIAPTDWNAIVKDASELTRRGRDAHAFGMLIDEEPQTQKIDRTQVPTVAGNLAWIAEREPLTPKDLLLLARSYRFWNRADEALRLLDALDAHPAWRGSDTVLYQRALTLRQLERYDEAAATWDRLARGRFKDRYEATAARERERLDAWQKEQAARREREGETHLPLVELRTTRGSIFALLHEDDVPDAVEHFLALVKRRDERDPARGFYDGTLFHRVVGGFLAQGGDPLTKTDGCDAGGPGAGPRRVNTETNPRHGFWRGALAFARGPELVNGAQFFVLTGPRPELGDKDYTCFGHVVAGMDVVDRLERCDELLEIEVLRDAKPSTSEDAEGRK